MTISYTVRFAAAVCAGVMSLCVALPTHAARDTQVAYFPAPGSGQVGGLLVNWKGSTSAEVVDISSTATGRVTQQGNERVIAFTRPLTSVLEGAGVDSCNLLVAVRIEVTHMVVRDISGNADTGTSQVATMGNRTLVGACNGDVTTSFGALTDAGATVSRIAMATRPAIADLVPGVQVAGLSEFPWPTGGNYALHADVVTLYAGDMAGFAASGNVVRARFSRDGWLVMDLPTAQRAYTRLAVDAATGAESWMAAEWSRGKPVKVVALLAVKAALPAGFGSEQHAARRWQSGMFSTSRQPFFVQLYEGGTGERISTDLDAGTETRRPITWALLGQNIVITTTTTLQRRDRTWVPVRNQGNLRFVLESEIWTETATGVSTLRIFPRVNFFIDEGPAIPPAPTTSGAVTPR